LYESLKVDHSIRVCLRKGFTSASDGNQLKLGSRAFGMVGNDVAMNEAQASLTFRLTEAPGRFVTHPGR
jgi:hypothetical protein